MYCYIYSRPAYGTPKILDKNGLTLKDIDVFEYHEAFAVCYHIVLWILEPVRRAAVGIKMA